MTPAQVRRPRHVLVADAHALGSLAVIRSLGRAGYRVIASSAIPEPLAFHSRYVAKAVPAPPYDDPRAVKRWLTELVAAERIDAIVPSEGLLLALLPTLSMHAKLLPCSSDAATITRCLSKYLLFESFLGRSDELGAHLPPTLLVHDLESLERALAAPWVEGSFVKLDAVFARYGAAGAVRRIGAADEARGLLHECLRSHERFVIQRYVAGIGVGVFFLVWNGEVRATFMHRRIHEVPHTGGASSFRCSWWHPRIHDDALRRVKHLDWQGVAMFEYRWDPATDHFHLLELNSRFWGSLHLALHAGVDFPRVLLDSFFGLETQPQAQPRSDVRCRYTFPKEVEYVWSRLKDGNLGVGARLWSVLEFMLLSLDPRIKTDLSFPGDRLLYYRAMWRFIGGTVGQLLRAKR